VPENLIKQDGACIRFTLMDYNFVVKNDFGGEAYWSLKDVPGVFNNNKGYTARLKPREFQFMKPQSPTGTICHYLVTRSYYMRLYMYYTISILYCREYESSSFDAQGNRPNSQTVCGA